MTHRKLMLVVTLAVSLVLLTAQLPADAQPTEKVLRIGIIPPGPLPPRMHQWGAFRQRLRELGYTEGRT